MSNAPLQPGQRIGNYLLQQEVGRGAFAVVWKAVHHERPTRTVAIKIATHPDYRRQLAREGRLPEIDHPNVVPILDCDTRFTHHPYIVTPFYANGSLADLITQHPSGLPEARVESLLKDILAGLSAAHQQGIVHRDIKPANILLDDAGRAVIADFGLSLSNGNPDARQSLMQSLSLERETTGKLAGTLAYMAPEVLSGSQATTAADVYSVGILLFEMLTGRRPAGFELPSQARKDIGRNEHFDRLFYSACRPANERFADALRMKDTTTLGRSVIPWSTLDETESKRIEQPVPKPERLRNNFSDVTASRTGQLTLEERICEEDALRVLAHTGVPDDESIAQCMHFIELYKSSTFAASQLERIKEHLHVLLLRKQILTECAVPRQTVYRTDSRTTTAKKYIETVNGPETSQENTVELQTFDSPKPNIDTPQRLPRIRNLRRCLLCIIAFGMVTTLLTFVEWGVRSPGPLWWLSTAGLGASLFSLIMPDDMDDCILLGGGCGGFLATILILAWAYDAESTIDERISLVMRCAFFGGGLGMLIRSIMLDSIIDRVGLWWRR